MKRWNFWQRLVSRRRKIVLIFTNAPSVNCCYNTPLTHEIKFTSSQKCGKIIRDFLIEFPHRCDNCEPNLRISFVVMVNQPQKYSIDHQHQTLFTEDKILTETFSVSFGKVVIFRNAYQNQNSNYHLIKQLPLCGSYSKSNLILHSLGKYQLQVYPHVKMHFLF